MNYVVIDEEFCKVARGARTSAYRLKNEIIQIGAVLLNDNFEVVSHFNEFVRPEYGHIDGFIRNLTGIDQYTVSKAAELENVMGKFVKWLPEEMIFVSWSLTDKVQLMKELESKKICFEKLTKKYENWIDCQAMFTEKIDGNKSYKLEEALNLSGVGYDGKLHDGLADAYNTAILFAKMQDDNFTTSQYYLRENDEQQELSFTLGNLFTEINIA